MHAEAGLDAKWTPNANTAIDATLNPDFSQVESDVAQIAANQRFALFFPEKRPFFLEGLELFSTPIQAVYTRTITSPRFGVRSTGEADGILYTALVAEDRGGGSVILPDRSPRTWRTRTSPRKWRPGRGRKDFGNSFASFLVTDREIEGGGHNRVLGPDFQWRPNGDDTVSGQLLVSQSLTPDRPDLAAEWDGRSLGSHAGYLNWSHSTRTWDWTLQYLDIGDEFRADLGFLPQVGVRDSTAALGRSFFVESGPFRRIPSLPAAAARHRRLGGGLASCAVSTPGSSCRASGTASISVEHRTDRVWTGSRQVDAGYFVTAVQMSPSLRVSGLSLTLTTGDDVDFANQRPARGANLVAELIVRPTDHLALQFDGSRRWLDVAPSAGPEDKRLFTAEVARVKATYTFTSRAFLRLIAQRVRTVRDLDLYSPALGLPGREEGVTGSALLSYKLNWQTVLFLGYSDDRALAVDDRLAPAGREIFLKVSYAFQR